MPHFRRFDTTIYDFHQAKNEDTFKFRTGDCGSDPKSSSECDESLELLLMETNNAAPSEIEKLFDPDETFDTAGTSSSDADGYTVTYTICDGNGSLDDC